MYVRLSELPHAHDTTSPESQREECLRKARELGLTVVEEFKDIDVPARKNTRRPGFEAAVKGLLEGRFSTLLVAKLDRLSRRGMGQVGCFWMILRRLAGAEVA